jgi:hypothetical protein
MGGTRHVDLRSLALQGLIEEIVLHEPDRAESETPPGSGTASSRDALRAITRLARAIEVPADAGDLPPSQAYRMAALLLVVRDFIQPLGPEADEHVTRYLTEVVEKLRR